MPQVAITEIMYNPLIGEDGVFSKTDFEFIELQNIGAAPVDIRGLSFPSQPVTFDFSDGSVETLAPGEHVVLARNDRAFGSRYGQEINLTGEYASGNLRDSGERVILEYWNFPLLDFTYDDAWYPSTDGEGYSLVLIDSNTPNEQLGDPASWRASSEIHGSPGSAEGGDIGGLQRPGDVNQDGSFNITDAVNMLTRLFGNPGQPLPCEGEFDSPGNTAVFDLNGDASANLTDPIFALTYLFQQGPAPVLGRDCTRIVGCPSSCNN